jgi:hypothetical protein
MKKLILSLTIITLFAACSKDDDTKPGGNGNNNGTGNGYVPSAALGKWQHGTFSMSNYWGYDGSFQGTPFTQTVAFDFKSNGTYEMYYIGQTNNFGCISDALSWFKGTVHFTDSTFTVKPLQGKFRGYYSCSPQYNFNRPAQAHELENKTYYYHFETDSNNKKWFVVGFVPNDPYPAYFYDTAW